MPLQIVRQHAEKYARSDSIVGLVKDGPHFQLDGLQIPKGRLDQFQGRPAHPGQPSMRGVLDPASLPIGGTNQSIVMPAAPLNFEVKGPLCLHDGHNILVNILHVNIIIQYNS
jgi:hypothetical protein